MRAYLATTGSIFGFIVIAHLIRVIHHEAALARDPWFILLTVVAAALSVWGWGLFLRSRRS